MGGEGATEPARRCSDVSTRLRVGTAKRRCSDVSTWLRVGTARLKLPPCWGGTGWKPHTLGSCGPDRVPGNQRPGQHSSQRRTPGDIKRREEGLHLDPILLTT